MSAPRRERRLYRRVYLHGLLLLVLVAVALGITGFLLGRDARWRLHPQRLVQHLAALLAPLSEEALQREVAHLARDLDVGLAVYRDDGKRLASSGESAPPPLSPAAVSRLADNPVSIRHDHFVLSSWAGPRRYLRLSFHGSESRLLLRAMGGLLVVVVVLALVSLPLARGIARPIERLSQAARRLGEGDLEARSGLDRRDEIGALARSFDEMADRLARLVAGHRELLADVSHELRTPLARMRVTLGLAEEADPEKARSYLRELEEDVLELERLVGDVLTTARLDATGALALRLEPVELRALTEQALARFQRAHPGRVVKATLAPAPAREADPGLLGRVLDNLLDNAAKYSDAETPIDVSLEEAQGSVAIAVRDRGIGVAAEDLPRLFTPFFRAERSRARNLGGAGLGLALSKRIVEAHGGRIQIASRPGEGTTVTVTLA
jgi:signal transduction histidine kinase